MDAYPRRLRRADVVIAVALAVAMAVAALATGSAAPLPRTGATIAATGLLTLAIRCRRPFTAAVVVVAVVLAEVVPAPQGTQAPAFLALLIAAYSLGAHAGRLALVAGVLTCTVGIGVAQVLAPPAGYSHLSAITFFAGILVVAPATVGMLVRTRRMIAGRVRASTETIRAETAVRLAEERADQRLRVNSDTEMVVLSGLERMRPHAAVRDLDDVISLRDLGRDLLGRMRELLSQLRRVDDATDSPRVPGQRLEDLRSQVERVLGAASGPPLPALRAQWTLLSAARVDLLLAVGTGAYALIVVSVYLNEPRLVAAGLVAVLPVAWIRRWPLVAAGISAIGAVVFTASAAPVDPFDGPVIAVTLIAFPLLIGAIGSLPTALVGLVICLVTALAASLGDRSGTAPWADLASTAVLAAGSWIAGRVLHAAAAALDADALGGVQADRHRREAIRLALEADRAQVARDLHDAVGHSMTGIVMQATAAVRVWDTDPPLARQHVIMLRQTVAEALDQLRPLIATVTIDGGTVAGLEGVANLVERARMCGLRPSVHIDGTVDSATGTIAYRVVQEALTNAARYAPGARVNVRITHVASGIAIEVANDRPPIAAGESSGSGHGVRGMAERVSGCGGTLEAVPTADGGFRVAAVLPVPTSDGAST